LEIELENATRQLEQLRKQGDQDSAREERQRKELESAQQKLDSAQERKRRAERDLIERKAKARRDALAKGTPARKIDPSPTLKNAEEDIAKHESHLERLKGKEAVLGTGRAKQIEQQKTEARRRIETAKLSLETQAHQSAIDRDLQKGAIDRRRLELAEEDSSLRKKEFEAKRKSELSALEASKYEAQARAAELKFDWERREESQESAQRHELSLQSQKFGHEAELARLSTEIAERATLFEVEAYAENAKVDGEISRKNTTHETTERIREARNLLIFAKEKRTHDTLMDAKLAIIKHHLEKDMLAYRVKLGIEGHAESVEAIAEVIRGIELHEKSNKN